MLLTTLKTIFLCSVCMSLFFIEASKAPKKKSSSNARMRSLYQKTRRERRDKPETRVPAKILAQVIYMKKQQPHR